ncbi:MAG: glutamate 5-kinase, partial [Treponema sp.]|nr:glutamate 5-kinase [Treponema sp.]
TDNPKTNPKAELVEQVSSIEELRKKITIGETNAFGTGGIETKIQAATKSTKYGIPMILANGGKAEILDKLADGSAKGTLFLAE